MGTPPEKRTAHAAHLCRAAEAYTFSHRRSLLDDALKTLKSARLYRIWMRWLQYFRRFRAVTVILKICAIVGSILQTGALVLLSTLLLFVLLPICLLLLCSLAAVSLINAHSSLKKLKKALKNKRVYVFFSASEDFGTQNAHALAKKEQLAVLVISPHWLSPKGLQRKRFYINLRQDAERLFLIRRSFYFRVKKKLLDPKNTVFIY